MRSFYTAAVVVAVVAAAPEARAGDHVGKVVWVNDPAAGLAKARREGLPTMLVFSAEW